MNQNDMLRKLREIFTVENINHPERATIVWDGKRIQNLILAFEVAGQTFVELDAMITQGEGLPAEWNPKASD